ncbi:MAG: hypothetical protein LH679_09540, partial [Cyanobacteria bacterium CAN_BIN43]|nr:hypothetical protein [Cyanobacteria bacterium CAN_BIN43]
MLNNSFGKTIASRAADDRQSGARNIGTLSGSKKFRGAVGVGDKADFYSFTLSGRSSFNLSLNKLKNNVDVFRVDDIGARSELEKIIDGSFGFLVTPALLLV